jgi:signal transduction histidine kinase/FixJ family two-component response regulator
VKGECRLNADEKQNALYAESENAKLSKQLNEAQQKLQLLLSSIPGGVAIYRLKKDGKVATEYVSEGLAAMCGYKAPEFLARLREDARTNIAPEDLGRVMQTVRSRMQRNEPISVSYRVYTKDGRLVPVRLDANVDDASVLGDDDVAVLYAVHTRVSAEALHIQQEQERYRAIMDYLDIAFFEWMPDKGFYASEKYKRYAMSQVDYRIILKNAGPCETVYPDDLPILKRFFKLASQRLPQASVTLRCKMTDGTYRWTEMMGFFSYDETGRRTKTVAVLRDVSQEWEEQNRRLQMALNDAEKANQAKTDFLSRVSYDMRTPLNGILGLTALLEEKNTDPDVRNDLDQMEAAGKYLLNLINDTLDVSRIENGKLELCPAVCEGREILVCILAMAEQSAKEKKIRLAVDASKLDCRTLYVDAGRVEQVLMNILGNALKFTPEGGNVNFTLASVCEKDGTVTDRFTIADDGIGIGAEYLPHLFEPFSQERHGTTSKFQGTGLGMSITKSIVEQMNGKISVESTPDKGTTFTILLPLPLATAAQIAAAQAEKALPYDENVLRGAQVLLCEDHPLNAEIARRLLEKMGIGVTHAENGKQGVELFAQSPVGGYQAVLMDIRMPVMDGLEATRQLRALPRADAGTVPVIALSANAFSEDVERAKAAGINEYLSKPFEPEKLYATLAQAVYTAKRQNADSCGTMPKSRTICEKELVK